MSDWVKGKVYKGYAENLLKASMQANTQEEQDAEQPDQKDQIHVQDQQSQQNQDLNSDQGPTTELMDQNRYKYPALHTLFDPNQQVTYKKLEIKQAEDDMTPLQASWANSLVDDTDSNANTAQLPPSITQPIVGSKTGSHQQSRLQTISIVEGQMESDPTVY